MTRGRQVLVLTHTGRPEAVQAAHDVIHLLDGTGLTPVMLADEAREVPHSTDVVLATDQAQSLVSGCDLVMVLGGDGTILRGAELVRGTPVPLLGVNLGHVGFLAESEREDLAEAVHRIAQREYDVEERMTLDVVVRQGGNGGGVVARTWAVNEASVEKGNRARMLEVVVEVDGRPLSTFGCDGVVAATPTGSTAYAFSAGGPVVWPEVEAMLVVPISAHALFSRPMVVSPRSLIAVEVLDRTGSAGVLWCDGRRTVPLEPGARIEVTRSSEPVRLARLVTAPFTDRLVAKFDLHVQGWRGPRGLPADKDSRS